MKPDNLQICKVPNPAIRSTDEDVFLPCREAGYFLCPIMKFKLLFRAVPRCEP